MKIVSWISGSLLLCLSSVPLAAQNSAPDGPIFVEGEREQQATRAREQAREITPRVGSIAAPLARFQDPVCPGILGLDQASAQRVIDRILYNAERIGLGAVRGEACQANIIIAFVADAREQFADLRQNDHYTVSGLDLWERKRVADQTGPVLAWNATVTKSRDGFESDGNPPTYQSTAISRTELATREDIELSVMLIEHSAIADLDGITVADYITMRALAKTRPPEGETNFGTVLSIFVPEQADAAPHTLSDFDLAYLTSLYSSRANLPSRLAMRDVGDLMDRDGE